MGFEGSIFLTGSVTDISRVMSSFASWGSSRRPKDDACNDKETKERTTVRRDKDVCHLNGLLVRANMAEVEVGKRKEGWSLFKRFYEMLPRDSIIIDAITCFGEQPSRDPWLTTTTTSVHLYFSFV